MSESQPSHPSDSFPRAEGSVSISEDMDFQNVWWRFERIAWYVLAVVLIADAIGLLGHGWLARTQRTAEDGTLRLSYDRIQRANAPSEITLQFNPAAVHNGRVTVFASQNIVKQLGAQRIIPEPQSSQIGPGGITYTFPAGGSPATVSIALQPPRPAICRIELRVASAQPVRAGILVLP